MLSSLFESKIEKNIYYFMCVIIDHQRGKYIKEILSEFIQVCFKRLNIKTGTIYSTYPLSEEQIKKIKQKVSITMDSNVRLVNKINKELVGGIKIQVDDYIIDYSLKHRLEQLKKELYNHRKEDHHEN